MIMKAIMIKIIMIIVTMILEELYDDCDDEDGDYDETSSTDKELKNFCLPRQLCA